MSDSLVGTRNFRPSEYERVSSGGRVPDAYRANAQRTLELLQRIRDVLGVPVIVTNGFRSPVHNAEIAGAALNSQHMSADAADFDVPSMTKRQVAQRLDAKDAELGSYRQLIYYLTDDHYHVGTGTKGERLVKSSAGYSVYAGADTLPDAHTPAGVVGAAGNVVKSIASSLGLTADDLETPPLNVAGITLELGAPDDHAVALFLVALLVLFLLSRLL